jgi:hypothetical protein
MNTKYSRRKAAVKYRTLLRSYLYDPPLWVYFVELAVAVGMILVIIFTGDDHLIKVLTQVLWGHV